MNNFMSFLKHIPSKLNHFRVLHNFARKKKCIKFCKKIYCYDVSVLNTIFRDEIFTTFAVNYGLCTLVEWTDSYELITG